MVSNSESLAKSHLVSRAWLGALPEGREAQDGSWLDLRDPEFRGIRVPYALRRVPHGCFARLTPLSGAPQVGDIALARVQKIGKNPRLELVTGRASALHVGDLLAVVFGNRYATMQFEGYARRNGNACDLLSMGGLCGLVESKHDGIAESTKLEILGALGDADGRPLHLSDFSVHKNSPHRDVQVVVVCGTSMDAGKTTTATSLIQGFCKQGAAVAGVKLTGTAAGRDTWGMLDAGACSALDFVDGGYPSTFGTSLVDLLDLRRRLVAHAAANSADWIVMEIADGLLQQETAALLTNREFMNATFATVLAAGDPLSAAAGVRLLREWGIEPVVVSGRVTMSALQIREAEAATQLGCATVSALQGGELAARLIKQQARAIIAANGCTESSSQQ